MQSSDRLMFKTEGYSQEGRTEVNLGTVVCKHCGAVIDTLNTDGAKVFYGECESQVCSSNHEKE